MTEMLDIVDLHDRVIGTTTKSELPPNAITRNVIVFLQDTQHRHLIQVRARTKKRFPGCYDFAACGHVKTGETYPEAAMRELTEELGICVPLTLLTTEYHTAGIGEEQRQHFSAYFHGKHDGECRLNHEVERVLLISPPKLAQLIHNPSPAITPYFIEEYHILMRLRGEL